MFVGMLEVQMKIFESRSLKDKRSVVKSISLRLRNKFNLAVCESDFNDMYDMAELGLVTVSNNRRHVDSMLETVLNELEKDFRIELLHINREVI